VESYQKLSEFLPRIWIDPVGSTDFGYQVNRPRKSLTIDGQRIQRLSKWSASLSGLIQLQVAPLVSQQSAILQEGQNACRIEIDISTDPLIAEPLPAAKLAPILDELIQLGLEITSQGDIE
jgi:hypothetical protein